MSTEGTFALRFVKSRESCPWVVMLPGAGATVAVWAPQLRAFGERFNLALVDFPGHGQAAAKSGATAHYSFDGLVFQLVNALKAAGITRCHVVALSLGTILARLWAARHPQQLQSMVLAGTIADLNPLARMLMRIGWYARWLLPFMFVYRMYAWIIMPGRDHRGTRRLFYRDAQTLGRDEFNRWFDLSRRVEALLRLLCGGAPHVPTLHVMGGQDHMFLQSCKKLATAEGDELIVIPNVGHVCSVEAAARFNEVALEFLERQSRSD